MACKEVNIEDFSNSNLEDSEQGQIQQNQNDQNADGILGSDELGDYVNNLSLFDGRTEDEEYNLFLNAINSLDQEAVVAGRRLKVVPSSVFGPMADEYSSMSDPKENNTFVNDAFRGRYGSYWSTDANKTRFVFINKQEQGMQKAPFEVAFGEIRNAQVETLYGRTVEKITLHALEDKFLTNSQNYSQEMWESYVRGGLLNRSTSENIFLLPTVSPGPFYTDYTFEMTLPFSKKEMEISNYPVVSMIADGHPEYNFYMKGYEFKTKQNVVNEKSLPNMYALSSVIESENPSQDMIRLIDLNNTFGLDGMMFKWHEPGGQDELKHRNTIKKYFDVYSRRYDLAVTAGKTEYLNQRFSNVLLSSDDYSLFKQYNEKRNNFPMYMNIHFSTDRSTTFAQILKDAKISNAFISRVARQIIDTNVPAVQCFHSTETLIQQRGSPENPITINSLQQTAKRYWNINDILSQIDQDIGTIDLSNALYLGDYERQLEALSGDEFKFFKSISLNVVFAKLRELVKQKFRTLRDIMSGVPAYSETVFYRVAKFEGKSIDTRPLQNYFFPNSNEIDVLRFIDTQVKYDKEYTYVVYAYQMVIGNKYTYTNATFPTTRKAEFEVQNNPEIYLFEQEFYKFSGKVLDDPPVEPDVDITSYKGIDDKLLILLNNGIGDYHLDPIAINQNDMEHFDKIRMAKNLKPESKIRFKQETYDYVNKFEAYRIDFHPESYRDFERGLKMEIQDPMEDVMSTAASFVDRIHPNKKYYYTFRAIDNHGSFSNPTPVIQVEMINEGGTIFLLKETVDFLQSPKTTTKQARRYIQLVPNAMQTLINEEASGFANVSTAKQLRNKVILGMSEESLWDKNFRIRLTSKSTGKKIDFLVKFDYKHKEKG